MKIASYHNFSFCCSVCAIKDKVSEPVLLSALSQSWRCLSRGWCCVLTAVYGFNNRAKGQSAFTSTSPFLPATSPALMTAAQCPCLPPGLWSTCRMREPDPSVDAPWGQRVWLWSWVLPHAGTTTVRGTIHSHCSTACQSPVTQRITVSSTPVL